MPWFFPTHDIDIQCRQHVLLQPGPSNPFNFSEVPRQQQPHMLAASPCSKKNKDFTYVQHRRANIEIPTYRTTAILF